MAPKSPSSKPSSSISKSRSPGGTSSSTKTRLRNAAADGTLDALFAKTRHDATTPTTDAKKEETVEPVPAPAPAAAATIVAPPAPPEVVLSKAEADELKSFDLDGTYGPMAGPTRLMRWERAKGLGLDPPVNVQKILQKLGDSHPARWSCWQQRV